MRNGHRCVKKRKGLRDQHFFERRGLKRIRKAIFSSPLKNSPTPEIRKKSSFFGRGFPNDYDKKNRHCSIAEVSFHHNRVLKKIKLAAVLDVIPPSRIFKEKESPKGKEKKLENFKPFPYFPCGKKHCVIGELGPPRAVSPKSKGGGFFLFILLSPPQKS